MILDNLQHTQKLRNKINFYENKLSSVKNMLEAAIEWDDIDMVKTAIKMIDKRYEEKRKDVNN